MWNTHVRVEISCGLDQKKRHVSVVKIPVQCGVFQMLCTLYHVGGWTKQSCAVSFHLLVVLLLAPYVCEEPSSRTERCSLYSPWTCTSCSHAGTAINWFGRSSKHVFPLNGADLQLRMCFVETLFTTRCRSRHCHREGWSICEWQDGWNTGKNTDGNG